MARIADRIHTGQPAIDRLQALVKDLDNGHRVSLLMDDGEVVQGIVTVKPTLQVFFGHGGDQGMNAVLRLVGPALERPGQAGWRDVWLDQVREVRHHNPP